MAAFVILIVSIAIGVLLSRWYAKKGYGKALRRTAGTVIGILVFIILLVTLVLPSGDSNKPTVKDAPEMAKASAEPEIDESARSPASPDEPAEAKTLPVDADQYLATLRKLFRDAEGGIEKGGPSDTLKAKLDSHVSVVGAVDKKTGKLKGAVFVVGNIKTADQLKAVTDKVRDAIVDALKVPGTSHAVRSMLAEYAVFGNSPQRNLGSYQILLSAPTPTVLTFALGTGNVEPPKDSKKHGSMAYIQCKDIIKNKLKAPSTADFPWTADAILRNPHNGNSYLVRGHVDAQNGFGAMLRAKWTCQIAYKGEGEEADISNWRVFNTTLHSS